MIKLFRNIRRKFLIEGNFKNYTLYAIGEILLVVIGILLALQVNTWNDARMANQKEDALLNELKTNLKANMATIEASIQIDLYGVNSANIVEQLLIEKSSNKDSLTKHVGATGYNEKINLISSAYSTMKSIGLEMINSDSIRVATITLFEVDYPALVEQTYNLRLIQFQELVLPMMNQYFRYSLESPGILIINNHSDLLNDQAFLNMVSMVKSWKLWSIDLKRKSLDQTQYLLLLIDNELKN